MRQLCLPASDMSHLVRIESNNAIGKNKCDGLDDYVGF